MSKKIIVLLVCAALVSGCTIMKIQGRGARPILLNTPDRQYDVVKHFTISRNFYFDYTRAPDISSMVADVLAETNADAVINLGFSAKTTFETFCVTMITTGFANGYCVQIEGDAIKYKE
jgi:tryptophanase